jgi:putative endonuclease
MYSVYILQSTRLPKHHYIGYTENIERRLVEHNSGRTESLVRYIPMKLIYTEKYQTRLEAMRREKQIKSYKGGAAFKKLINLF